MENTITITWSTGHIDLCMNTICDIPISNIKKMLALEEVDPEGVKSALYRACTSRIRELENCEDYVYDRDWTIDRLSKIAALCKPAVKMTARLKALARIIKAANPQRPAYCGVFQQNGYSCIVDGYRALRTTADTSMLTAAPDAPNRMDLCKTIDDARDTMIYELALPPVKLLKSLLKAGKAAEKANQCFCSEHVRWSCHGVFMYDFGTDLPAVNLAWLIDMLESMPGARLFCSDRAFAPLYIVSDDADGIILPIKKRADIEEFSPVETSPAVLPNIPMIPVPENSDDVPAAGNGLQNSNNVPEITNTDDLENSNNVPVPANARVLENSELPPDANENTIVIEIVRTFDHLYYSSYDPRIVLPEYVNYRNLRSAFRKEYGIELPNLSELIFNRFANKAYAYIAVDIHLENPSAALPDTTIITVDLPAIVSLAYLALHRDLRFEVSSPPVFPRLHNTLPFTHDSIPLKPKIAPRREKQPSRAFGISAVSRIPAAALPCHARPSPD